MKKINLKDVFHKKEKVIDFGTSMAWPVNFLRDWKIIVLVFAIGLLLLSAFAWKIYLSNRIGGGYLAGTAKPADIFVKTMGKGELQTDLLILENKQYNYLKLKASSIKLVDPSL